ncbi:unnamed protein product [Urochloa humidicola]
MEPSRLHKKLISNEIYAGAQKSLLPLPSPPSILERLSLLIFSDCSAASLQPLLPQELEYPKVTNKRKKATPKWVSAGEERLRASTIFQTGVQSLDEIA